MFDVVGSAGVVRNIGVVDSRELTATVRSASLPIPTTARSHTRTRLASSDQASLDGPDIGGLVGTNYGTVERSWSAVDINAEGMLGGLVGHNMSGATIRESYATGEVVQFGHGGPGGLVGFNEGLISASYATGNVSASASLRCLRRLFRRRRWPRLLSDRHGQSRAIFLDRIGLAVLRRSFRRRRYECGHDRIRCVLQQGDVPGHSSRDRGKWPDHRANGQAGELRPVVGLRQQRCLDHSRRRDASATALAASNPCNRRPDRARRTN